MKNSPWFSSLSPFRTYEWPSSWAIVCEVTEILKSFSVFNFKQNPWASRLPQSKRNLQIPRRLRSAWRGYKRHSNTRIPPLRTVFQQDLISPRKSSPCWKSDRKTHNSNSLCLKAPKAHENLLEKSNSLVVGEVEFKAAHEACKSAQRQLVHYSLPVSMKAHIRVADVLRVRPVRLSRALDSQSRSSLNKPECFWRSTFKSCSLLWTGSS